MEQITYALSQSTSIGVGGGDVRGALVLEASRTKAGNQMKKASPTLACLPKRCRVRTKRWAREASEEVTLAFEDRDASKSRQVAPGVRAIDEEWTESVLPTAFAPSSRAQRRWANRGKRGGVRASNRGKGAPSSVSV